jgi:hypothetical protein
MSATRKIIGKMDTAYKGHSKTSGLPEGVPPAYALALQAKEDLDGLFKEVETSCGAANRHAVLKSFLDLVDHSGVAINMTIPICVALLETGNYYNVYEWLSESQRISGVDLENAVREKLSEWYEPRKTIERILRIDQRTHYAAANMGGAGVTRYGDCCVVLNGAHITATATCFAGDSIRAVFSPALERILTDDEVLSRFAAHDDRGKLAAVRHGQLLSIDAAVFDRTKWRNVLEASDSLLEVHIHTNVGRQHVAKIVFGPKTYDHLCDLCHRFESLKPNERGTLEFDVVPYFKKLLDLATRHNVPVETC